MGRAIRLLAIAIAFASASCNYNPENNLVIRNPEFKAIDDTITARINRRVMPSFSVGVSKNGKVIWRQSFGLADIERNIRATPETPYALGSLSKSLTSTGLMILEERGLLKFEDPVDTYLGKAKLTYYQGKPGSITINHLTNMMGGIPHQYTYLYPDENRPTLTMEEQVRHYGIVVFPPGDVFNYSNFSPGLAEQIIVTVSHQELDDFMEDNLFKPAGMLNSAVRRDKFKSARVAKGYDSFQKPLVPSEFHPSGGAGYYASVQDILQFGMLHLNDKILANKHILSPQSIEKLHSANKIKGFNKLYSNGWGVLQLDHNNTSLLSNGAIDGTASSLLILPRRDIAIACVTNASLGNDFTDQLAFSIANILSPGYMDDLGAFVSKYAPEFEDKPFVITDSIEGKWEGMIMNYKDTVPVDLIFEKKGRAFLRIRDQFETIVNNLYVSNGLITGQSYGSIWLNETRDIPQILQLTLKLKKDEIYGSISAESYKTEKPYFLIPSYIWLKKTVK